MALVHLNGRTHYFPANEVIVEELGAGNYLVHYDGRSFDVMGGRDAGGSSREWFVRHDLFYGDRWLPAKSMVEAIRLGIQY